MTDTQAMARPDEGSLLASARPSPETIDLLRSRRSAKWLMIAEPGPSPTELEQLLSIASRVPDHGKLAPWRFIVVSGAARQALGETAAQVWAAREPNAPPERLDLERNRFAKVPAAVFVVSRVNEQHKIPVWEQELSSGAVCMTLLIAAHAMGYAGSWVTEWIAFDPEMKARLGLKPGERLAGIVGLGTAGEVEERRRPDVTTLISHWSG